jgi:FkbM family methyltransferase
MISYAQNFEDVMLARVFANQERGFYVDVGAWHPTSDSVTRHFYDLGWSGVNVEPAPEYLTLLEEERPRDLNLGVVVGRPGPRQFHRVRGSGLSTLLPSLAHEAAASGFTSDAVEIDAVSLADVCRAHVRGGIDFLKVDVEGAENEVIESGDWQAFRPRIVLVEAVAPASASFSPGGMRSQPAPTHQSYEPFLLAQGYGFCYFDGLNRFYLRHEDSELASSLTTPPNVFDGFVPYAIVKAERELDAANQAAQAQEGRARAAELRLAAASVVLGKMESVGAELVQGRSRDEESKSAVTEIDRLGFFASRRWRRRSTIANG